MAVNLPYFNHFTYETLTRVSEFTIKSGVVSISGGSTGFPSMGGWCTTSGGIASLNCNEIRDVSIEYLPILNTPAGRPCVLVRNPDNVGDYDGYCMYIHPNDGMYVYRISNNGVDWDLLTLIADYIPPHGYRWKLEVINNTINVYGEDGSGNLEIKYTTTDNMYTSGYVHLVNPSNSRALYDYTLVKSLDKISKVKKLLFDL